MKIEPGLLVALDTNILLDATDEGRPRHVQAGAVFRDLPRQGVDLFLCTQVIREYLVVATRPPASNGLGMSNQDAGANVEAFRKRASVIPETLPASDLFLTWARHFQITGKRLHDLQLLATIHQAGVRVLLTSNPDDFPKDTGVRIATLLDLEKEDGGK